MTENTSNPDLPIDWEELKHKRAKMDNEECHICGTEDELFVVFQNDPEEHGYDVSNLITTCNYHVPGPYKNDTYQYTGEPDDPMMGGRNRTASEESTSTSVSSSGDLYGADSSGDTAENPGENNDTSVSNTTSSKTANTDGGVTSEEDVGPGEVIITTADGAKHKVKSGAKATFSLGNDLSDGILNFLTTHSHDPVSKVGNLPDYQKNSDKIATFFTPTANHNARWIGERIWKPTAVLLGALLVGLMLLNGPMGGLETFAVVLKAGAVAAFNTVMNPASLLVATAVLYTGNLLIRDHMMNIYPMRVTDGSIEWANTETQLWAGTVSATIAGIAGWVVLNTGVVTGDAMTDAAWVFTHILYSAGVGLGVVAIRDVAVQEVSMGWGYTTQLWDYPVRLSALFAIPGPFVFSGLVGTLVAVAPIAVFAAFMVRSYFLTNSVFNPNCDRDVMPSIRALEPKCVWKDG